jgi:hypothetical protein
MPSKIMGQKLSSHELTHSIQQESSTTPIIQRMPACPPRWPEPLPSGWQEYHGNPNVFHCGFRGILEDRIPTPDNPQNECLYDHSGALVDQNHPYSGCRGTPNQYDSADSPISHALLDSGGILRAGAPAFETSRLYDIDQSIAGAIRIVETVGSIAKSVDELLGQIGQAIGLGILTARATVNPANWEFQDFPVRSIRHLNVIGSTLSSISLNQNLDNFLTSITRKLDSYPIGDLITEIVSDINQTLLNRNSNASQVSASNIGSLSLLHLIDWLHSQGFIQYSRLPIEIGREELSALQKSKP